MSMRRSKQARSLSKDASHEWERSTIRIELTRAGGTVTAHWPPAATAQCAQVLRELLR